jgi:hypothetical protein
VGSKRTGVFEFIGDGGATVWSGFVGKEVSQRPLLVLTDDGQGKLDTSLALVWVGVRLEEGMS